MIKDQVNGTRRLVRITAAAATIATVFGLWSPGAARADTFVPLPRRTYRTGGGRHSQLR
ncbi:hypothetical protein [Nocardia wallacei]|uniref:hypothetical protein n=1 Tax=Nocardia wallacei TaxID=480035 RepID=UPI00313C2DD5